MGQRINISWAAIQGVGKHVEHSETISESCPDTSQPIASSWSQNIM